MLIVFLAFFSIQLLTFILMIYRCISHFKIPESPVWLLSKNREFDAQKSLQWLRGWVSEKSVQVEFTTMKRYNEYSNSCTECQKANIKCTHPSPTMKQKFNELLRRRTVKPFVILLVCNFIGTFSGIHHLMPYIVQILITFESPISPNWATVYAKNTKLHKI